MERQEHEKGMREAGRIPPGQSLTQELPVLHFGSVPDFNAATWDFQVWGEVEKTLRLTWYEINQLPRTKLVMDLHCVTRWSHFNAALYGVSVRTLIDEGLVKMKTTAKFVIQQAEHGYSTNLPLDLILGDNFLLATHYNGKPLTPDHGFPLRGVIGAIPGRDDLKVSYLWKGAKWLRGLEFVSQERRGFWEQAGYHNEGDVWKEQRFA